MVADLSWPVLSCPVFSLRVPTCPNCLNLSKTCLNISQPLLAYADLTQPILTCPDCSWPIYTCQDLSWPIDLSRLVKTCPNFSWPVPTCHELSRLVMIWTDLSWPDPTFWTELSVYLWFSMFVKFKSIELLTQQKKGTWIKIFLSITWPSTPNPGGLYLPRVKPSFHGIIQTMKWNWIMVLVFPPERVPGFSQICNSFHQQFTGQKK